MPSAYRLPSASDATPPKRRAAGLALALGINLLLLLALIGLGVSRPDPVPMSDPTIVTLAPDTEDPSPASAPAAPKPPTTPPPEPRPAAPPPSIVKLPPAERPPLDLLVISKEELAASDIAALPSAPPGAGSSAGDSQEVGRGPNGEILYAAEWARRPTNAELGPYLPRNMPDEGWGLIACRTMADRRVEDCVELESFPLTSYLARAVRNAAWQFRVRPPRKNGREMVGEWVSIRIDYSRR